MQGNFTKWQKCIFNVYLRICDFEHTLPWEQKLGSFSKYQCWHIHQLLKCLHNKKLRFERPHETTETTSDEWVCLVEHIYKDCSTKLHKMIWKQLLCQIQQKALCLWRQLLLSVPAKPKTKNDKNGCDHNILVDNCTIIYICIFCCISELIGRFSCNVNSHAIDIANQKTVNRRGWKKRWGKTNTLRSSTALSRLPVSKRCLKIRLPICRK